MILTSEEEKEVKRGEEMLINALWEALEEKGEGSFDEDFRQNMQDILYETVVAWQNTIKEKHDF